MKKPKVIKAGRYQIGGDHPCFIVAEAGANHDGSFEKAKALISAAAATGADSIKFQHYTAEKIAAPEAQRYWYVYGDEPGFQFNPDRYKESQRSTFAKIDGIPRNKDIELANYAESKNVLMFSTPFDYESVDHLDALGIPLFKIASGDLTYHQFLEYVARKGKPVVLSTGAANLDEIRAAVKVVLRTGNDQLILLHCTLAYPAPLAHANLLMMRHLAEEFPGIPIGLSDHTPGAETDVAAAILGAVMIEKHFTHTPGAAAGENKVGDSPDHDIGIGPTAFTEMVRRIRENEKKGRCSRMKLGHDEAVALVKSGPAPEILGSFSHKKVDSAVELKARLHARRSIVTEIPLPAGTIITADLIASGRLTCKRPGTGIPPYEIGKLKGRVVKTGLAPDTVLKWEYFS